MLITLALHGGAGTILPSLLTPTLEAAYKAALQHALHIGYNHLEQGHSALDAVEATVIALEDCHLFNAGKGAVFTADGTHEMDASIMNGKDLQAGAVTLVTGVKNPVHLARLVMERSEHVLLGGEGAMRFAKAMEVTMEEPAYFHDDYRFQQWQEIKDTDTVQLDHSAIKEQKFGTVGAVALDQHGNIAAATSTGGMTNKRFGRIGDSPIIGSGTYADNRTCAISCTGSGEYFLRKVVAYEVSALMEFKGLDLEVAAGEVIHHRLKAIDGDGGLVAVDAKGNITMPFNTEGMYRACKDSNGREEVKIYQ